MTGRRPGSSRGRPAWRDDRLWQAGFLVGSALGAAATVLGRRAERVARQGLVDWPAAERYAVERLRSAPGALSAAELRAAEGAGALGIPVRRGRSTIHDRRSSGTGARSGRR